jgi:hypothetical protein
VGNGALAAWCAYLRIAEEDAKRPNRERECLVRERTRLVNRMKGTLATLREPAPAAALRIPKGPLLLPNVTRVINSPRRPRGGWWRANAHRARLDNHQHVFALCSRVENPPRNTTGERLGWQP